MKNSLSSDLMISDISWEKGKEADGDLPASVWRVRTGSELSVWFNPSLVDPRCEFPIVEGSIGVANGLPDSGHEL